MSNQAKGIIKHIPNSITSLNILSGCIASILALNNHLIEAAALIMLAAIFDFFDGFAARLLKAYSPMGKELDSLADMLSFGFAPACVVFTLMRNAVVADPTADIFFNSDSYCNIALMLSPFIISIFSGLRLAKFNVDTRQSTSFIGIPTPANALFWISWPVLLHYGDYPTIEKYILDPYILLAAILITSYLLVAEIPMFSLKISNLSWKDNKVRYSFIISIIILTCLIQSMVIPLVIILYVIFSIIENIFLKK